MCFIGALLGSFYWPYGTISTPEANNILLQAWLCSITQILYNCIMNHSCSHGGSSHTVRESSVCYQADNVLQVGKTTRAEVLSLFLSDSHDVIKAVL